MSGGSMNYLYRKVLHQSDFPLDTPEREAFAAHLKLVAQALHDIEWVDSGDYGPGDENAAIRACLSERKPLTEEEAAALIELDPRMLTEFGTAASGAAMELIRRTERAHGIGDSK